MGHLCGEKLEYPKKICLYVLLTQNCCKCCPRRLNPGWMDERFKHAIRFWMFTDSNKFLEHRNAVCYLKLNILQTTVASLSSHESSQMVPRKPFLTISTRPDSWVPFTRCKLYAENRGIPECKISELHKQMMFFKSFEA